MTIHTNIDFDVVCGVSNCSKSTLTVSTLLGVRGTMMGRIEGCIGLPSSPPANSNRPMISSSSVMSVNENYCRLTTMTLWRNGSASDSRSEGCVFESRQGHFFLHIHLIIFGGLERHYVL